MGKRQSNRPDRRFIDDAETSEEIRRELFARVRYAGSANHKLHPGDYGFHPPQNPRPSKSTCDAVRTVLLAEASRLIESGIMRGMVSRFDAGGVPKYVWAVDENDDVYEIKSKPEQENVYHGYRLGDDDIDMRRNVLKEWKRRDVGT
ncbi:hypothetical protein [Aquidulcibacter sp.]|uniref:hypothetical protein n=1 Tax=Aquidulcibacter sp. TaxID=2052990 RepID=UPI0028AAAA64|nr:hypothetical protein [Aquidulcibacter sp.]